MPVKSTLNLQAIGRGLIKDLVPKVNNALQQIKKGVDEKTPEDTRTLLGNTKIEEARVFGDTVTGRVYNNTEYAYYVETGVSGKVFSYQKPKGNKRRYVGEGARMFTRTADQFRPKIKQLLG